MSEIKVNKLSPRTNCGTVQLGDSGDTITIPAGATITNNGTAAGFGATGAASWDTTVKTSGFTAVSGVGYFVNTTSGAISVNLPAGTAGDVVAIKDYANTFDTNNVTLVVNGSDKIGGLNINGTLSVEGLAVTLVYVDATKGWLVTDNGTQDTAPTALYITATGGTITTVCTDYKVHTFTGPGTFTVSCAGNCAGSNSVDYLVVAGGGSGGTDVGGGGGAGGFRESSGTASGSYTASPLGAGVSALPVSVQGYTITVGGGATVPAPGTQRGNDGNPSTFSTITSAGGGSGGGGPATVENKPGAPGGSGGGGGGWSSSGSPCAGNAGTGNTPPVSPSQGFNGGEVNPGGPTWTGAGGGGATAVGVNGAPGPLTSFVAGGAGATTSISASPVTYSAGGSGGGDQSTDANTTVAPDNSGGGGGGAGNVCTTNLGNAGGSGIVIIRYKFQN